MRFTALLHHVTSIACGRRIGRFEPEGRAGGGRGDVGGTTGWISRTNLRDLHARVHRGLPGEAVSEGVHTEARRAAAAARGRGAGGQDPSAGGGRGAERDLREDFLGFSYGFRPGRSPHDALDALAAGIVRKRVNWVLDAGFPRLLLRLDHQWLERFLEHRIADRRILRLIQKWMAAGVIEEGSWTAYRGGRSARSFGFTVARERLRALRLRPMGPPMEDAARARRLIIVRFADDFVVGFEHREDAERFWAELRDRLAKFGLELNAEKTRLIEFGRFAARDRKARGSASLRRSGSWVSRTSAGRPGSRAVQAQADHRLKAVRAKLHAVKSEMATAHAPAHPRAGSLARQRPARAPQLLRACPTTSRRCSAFRNGPSALATGRFGGAASAPADLGADAAPRDRWLPRPRSASLARRTFRRQDPRQEPSAVVRARWDLCGGRVELLNGEDPSLPRSAWRRR